MPLIYKNAITATAAGKDIMPIFSKRPKEKTGHVKKTAESVQSCPLIQNEGIVEIVNEDECILNTTPAVAAASRPIRAGLKIFFPSPPKNCFPASIAIAAETPQIHKGVDGAITTARIPPVARAEKSRIVNDLDTMLLYAISEATAAQVQTANVSSDEADPVNTEANAAINSVAKTTLPIRKGTEWRVRMYGALQIISEFYPQFELLFWQKDQYQTGKRMNMLRS
jgi:hypothetical protein